MTKDDVAIYEIASSMWRPLFRFTWLQPIFGKLFALSVNAKWDRYRAFLNRNSQ